MKREQKWPRWGVFQWNATAFSRGKRRDAFVDRYDGKLSQSHLCNLLEAADRGYRSWRWRPISPCHRDDIVILVHIREQYRLSLGSFGRPRMTDELQELGLEAGHAVWGAC